MIFSETREIKDQSHNLYSREMLIKFVFSGGDSTFRIRHLWLRLFLECFNLCAQARRGRKSTTDSLPLHVGWLAFIVKTFWCLEFDLAGLQAEQLDVSLPDFCALQLVCGWWCFWGRSDFLWQLLVFEVKMTTVEAICTMIPLSRKRLWYSRGCTVIQSPFFVTAR